MDWIGEHLKVLGILALTGSWTALLYFLGVYDDIVAFVRKHK